MNLSLLQYLIALFTVLLILSYFLIRHYASIQTSCGIQLLATVSFALGFSGTILLPIDLSLTAQYRNSNDDANDDNNNDNNANDIYDNYTMMPWHILFWSTFILAWVILPLVREMMLSGEFTIYTRFKDGMRKMLVGHLILLALVFVFIIWLALHLKEVNVIPVLIALGNTYGLILVALLMGYGLVAFPRSMWRQARPQHELRKVHLMAVKSDDALFEAVWQLQDVEYKIDCAVARIVDLDENMRSDLFYTYCVNELLHRKNETAELQPEVHLRRTTTRRNASDDEYVNNGYDGSQKPSLKELVELNRSLKRAQEDLFNAQQRWNAILDKSKLFSGIDPNADHSISCSPNDATSTSLPLSPAGGARIRAAPLLIMADQQIKTCNSRLMHVWIRYLRAFVYRLAALFFAILSMAILWSEATLGSKYNLSPFALVQQYLSSDDDDQDGFLFQIAALVPLLYMAICTSNGLFQVGKFGPYCLRGNRQSHGVALVFNAQYLVRLQFPLAYNYLMMLKYDTSETSFSTFLGQMDVVPLFGKSFPVYAPLLILFLCAFTLCNIYAKVLNLLGFDHQDALLLGDKETLDEKVNEGKALLHQHSNGSIPDSLQARRAPSPRSEPLEIEISEKKSLNEIV
jgi:hypothetical protein